MKEEWRTEQLIDVCHKITQGPNPKYDKAGIQGYRVHKTKDLYDNTIHYEAADTISEAVFSKHLRAELVTGDVLLAIVGQGSINKCNVFEANEEVRFIFTRALGLIRPNADRLNRHCQIKNLGPPLSSRSLKPPAELPYLLGYHQAPRQEGSRNSYLKS